jgi:hypothetical protein
LLLLAFLARLRRCAFESHLSSALRRIGLIDATQSAGLELPEYADPSALAMKPFGVEISASGQMVPPLLRLFRGYHSAAENQAKKGAIPNWSLRMPQSPYRHST